MIEYRPSCGGGSCAACLGALGLDAVKQDGRWYCTPTCAQGLGPAEDTQTVADARLYNRPRRYFRKRLPKELRGAQREILHPEANANLQEAGPPR